jgi:hypothetical protein
LTRSKASRDVAEFVRIPDVAVDDRAVMLLVLFRHSPSKYHSVDPCVQPTPGRFRREARLSHPNSRTCRTSRRSWEPRSTEHKPAERNNSRLNNESQASTTVALCARQSGAFWLGRRSTSARATGPRTRSGDAERWVLAVGAPKLRQTGTVLGRRNLRDPPGAGLVCRRVRRF